MIKKITLILVLLCCINSCGKKGNPEYKETKKKNLENIITVI
tara:strand:- start:4963 stop:5088 length:126 start_codon:yes stop_codon:yes gene_type:complete